MKGDVNHLKKTNIRHLAGSFTIEAAILFPIVLTVIFCLIMLSFSIHDTVAAKNLSYRYLISYSMRNQGIYSYSNGFPYNIKNEFDQISILHQNPEFKFYQDKNNLRIFSSCFSIPVTFSNYNNTDLLQAYLAGKTLLNETID